MNAYLVSFKKNHKIEGYIDEEWVDLVTKEGTFSHITPSLISRGQYINNIEMLSRPN